MGLRIDAEVLEHASAHLRAAGVRRIEFDPEGAPSAVEFYEEHDTIPVPPPSVVVRPPSPTFFDPHPELIPEDEPTSEAIARELEALASRVG